VHSATIDRVPKCLAVAAIVLVAALVGGACSSESANAPKAPLAFCQAAARYDDRVSRNAKIDEQIRLVQRMVDTAPAKIKADAQTFVDALRRVETDKSVKDDPRVKRTVENVNRYAAQGCGFYKQQGGGGI
jgi:negative regulator of sigma E activity